MVHLYEATAKVCKTLKHMSTFEETKLTSTRILYQITADTARVEKGLSYPCPTQTHLTPLACDDL